MPYIDTTVWIDDEEMTTQDLEDYDDDELIAEIKSRGFKVFEDQDYIGNLPPELIQALYAAYTTMPPELFRKELKKFFRENLNVSEY